MKARSGVEWLTFAIAAAIVVVVIGLVAIEIPASRTPPAPVVAVGDVEERAGRFVVPVTVRNEGEQTAISVQVAARLTVGDEEHDADQSVDFLSGGEEEELEFVFEDDPDEGDLEVLVTGYTLP